MTFVTIYNGLNPAETGAVFARLEAANFHPFMPDDSSAYPLPLGKEGCRVQVPEAEAVDAEEFLKS